MIQDSLGFLWFGTREGLNKYDGIEFITYTANLDDPDALSDSTITALEESANGTLWVGTRYGGLNRFDPNNKVFKQVSLCEEAGSNSVSQINDLLFDSEMGLWVGTQSGLRKLALDDGGSLVSSITRMMKPV